ncbi:transposase [Deinococcus hopiensis]|uniref:transposase n=1 Tax=Deinococcus hopiensis TaxID=309885 RepID=UPI001FE98EB3|nr:transposase [Deinococcus hopiensis]
MPSQMACSARRQVAATYKGLWTKLKKHNEREARLCPEKPRRKFRPFNAAPKFSSRTLEYQYGKDYTWKKGQQISVLTLEGRQVMAHEGYSRHLNLIAQGCEVGAAKLSYQKSKKQYSLLVSLEVDLPDPPPEDHTRIVGVDAGQRYHAVVTDNPQRSKFFSGKSVNQKKDHFVRIRKSLQRKGTRSATRRLVAFSRRERRFIAQRNHSLASQILKLYPHALIGLGNLKDIRSRTAGRSNPKATKKAKRAKRRRSPWSFAELQTFLDCKAPPVGSMAVKVDANYTSQSCTRCGYTRRENRPGKGRMFACKGCGSQVHAGLRGGRNIALRTLVIRQDPMATEHLSIAPDVADLEAKAVRLSRYAELRWSPATSA